MHAGAQARRRAGAHGCGAVDLDVPNRFGARSGRTPVMNRMLQRAPRLLLLARRPVTAVNVAKPAQVHCRVAERHPDRGWIFSYLAQAVGFRLSGWSDSGILATAVCAVLFAVRKLKQGYFCYRPMIGQGMAHWEPSY